MKTLTMSFGSIYRSQYYDIPIEMNRSTIPPEKFNQLYIGEFKQSIYSIQATGRSLRVKDPCNSPVRYIVDIKTIDTVLSSVKPSCYMCEVDRKHKGLQ